MKPLSIKRIVVATDFSDGSDAALEPAFGLARRLDAGLEVVHVLDPSILTAPPGLGSIALADAPALVEEIDRALAQRAERAQSLGVPCETKVLEGFPSSEIVRHAQKVGADLIIMGTHGRTGLAHVVLGSVAERVVQRATCPVMVVPSPRAGN